MLDTSRAGPLALRGSALRVGGYGGGMLLALISAPLLVRHLHQVGYGRYVTALSIATIAASLTEGGVNTIALREFASRTGRRARRGDGEPARLPSAAQRPRHRSPRSPLPPLAGYSRTIVIGTLIAGLGLTLQVVQTLVSVPLQATMRLGWVAAADLLRNAVSTVLIVALVIAGAGIVPLLGRDRPGLPGGAAADRALVRGLMPLRPSLRPRGSTRRCCARRCPFAVAIALSSIYFRVTVVVMSLEATRAADGILLDVVSGRRDPHRPSGAGDRRRVSDRHPRRPRRS